MSDALKDFDFFKILFWIVPGAFMVLSRSFAIRGAFPALKKDDLSTLVLGSVVYSFVLMLFGIDLSAKDAWKTLAPPIWIVLLVIVPAVIGFGLGLVEASDVVGRSLRSRGIRLPSPESTAWESLFRELGSNAILIVTLKDGGRVFGRWAGGRGGSAASADPQTRDLYLAEIGSVDTHGRYVSHVPRRGAYIAADEIRSIEVVRITRQES